MAFCGKCGASIASETPFCIQCGQPVATSTASGMAAAVQPARSETKFFDQGDVLVTNSRFVNGGQTFAMSGVTSVMAFEEIPSKKGPIIIIVIGVLILLGGMSSSVGAAFMGLVIAAAGVWWYRTIKNIYRVRLVTASSKRDAMSSTNSGYIANIVNAINQAIIHRG